MNDKPHRYTVLIDPLGEVFGADDGETAGGPGSVLSRVVTIPLRDHDQMLDRIHAAVMDHDDGSDQLAAIYEILGETGRVVP